MVASEAEKRKVQNQVLGKDENITCETVSRLNDIDYENCYIEFLNNQAYVTIIGSNKFEDMYICKGTKTESKVVDRCPNERVSVTIEPAGGIITNLSGIYKEGDVIELENPEKENATFLNWNVVKGNSTLFDNKLTVGSEDTIVWAEYEEWGELIIDLDGGSVSNNQSGKYKSNTTIELEVPLKENYKFIEWEKIEGNGIVSGTTFTMGSLNTKIKAKWELNVFKLNVELNGGTISKDYIGDYEVGSTITIENPTKAGYTFEGWNISGSDASINDNVLTMGTEDITITAKWIANTNTAYVVKHWTQNLGASTTQNSTNYTVNSTENKTGTTASSVTPSVKTITGFTSPSTQTKTIAADGSMVIDYYYTRNSYTYTLGSKTGVTTTGSSTTGSYQYGATITLKASANAGYTWSKWTSSNTSLVSDKTTADTTFKMPAGNVTMTPNVTVNTYTISYTLNGGTKGSSAPTSGTYGSTVTVSNPTRTGYEFTGWSVSGTGSVLSGTKLTIGSANVTLTANWRNTNPLSQYKCANSSKGSSPVFTYSGNCSVIDDGSGNWRVKFLNSGTIVFNANISIDVFLVGGAVAGVQAIEVIKMEFGEAAAVAAAADIQKLRKIFLLQLALHIQLLLDLGELQQLVVPAVQVVQVLLSG